jgi:ABC-2 type transport system permease protein
MSDFRVFVSLVKSFVRESLRNKVELFFTIFFPLVFLVIFGLFFGGEAGFTLNAERVGINIQTDRFAGLYEQLESKGIWDLRLFGDSDSMAEAVRDNAVLVGVSVSEDELLFYFPEGDPGRISRAEMTRASLAAAIEESVNDVRRVVNIERKPVAAGVYAASGIDYIISGVVAISILSAGMFAVITVFGRYRKTGVLRRIKVTPVNPTVFILGSTAVRFLMGFLAVFILVFFARVMFGVGFHMNWGIFVLSIIVSILGMMALGMLLVLVFREPESASNAASILMMLMMFLSGVYFPVIFLPNWMQVLASFLPVTYVAKLIRFSAGIEAMSITSFLAISATFIGAGFVTLGLVGKGLLRAE